MVGGRSFPCTPCSVRLYTRDMQLNLSTQVTTFIQFILYKRDAYIIYANFHCKNSDKRAVFTVKVSSTFVEDWIHTTSGGQRLNRSCWLNGKHSKALKSLATSNMAQNAGGSVANQ